VRDDANFATTLSTRAAAHSDRTALIEPGSRSAAGGSRWRAVSFGELESMGDCYACGLARHGVRRGDRALYLLRPSIESYAVFYALVRLGAVPVLIDPVIGLRRLLACIETARPRVIMAVPIVHVLRTFARRAFGSAEVLITTGHRWLWRGVRLSQCRASTGHAAVGATAPADPSLLPFTSGATGPAKPVHYDHEMLRRQVGMLREVCGWREGMQAVMCFAPFVPYALADGLTAILPDIDYSRPAAADPARVVESIAEHGAECAFASPIVWAHLARYCERKSIALPTLQRAISAGAPVSTDLHRRLKPILHPDGQLYTPYGATEAMPLTTTHTSALADTWEHTRRGHGICIGRPLSGVDVWIIRVTEQPIPVWSDDLCLPTDSVGEIVVGGGIVSPVYPGRPDETHRAKIRQGDRVLHRTGDLGRRDAGGRLWFCGRKSQRIETRDGMLAPVAVESVFNQHPAVFRTALVGVGEPGGEMPVACVELEPGKKFSPQLEAELIALTRGTWIEGRVTRFLAHRGFPVDVRHNSKIRRDVLARWATSVLGSRAAGS
jgi:acyl-CoA synthetase (AMP-forming)/AMP-acid ligase II